MKCPGSEQLAGYADGRLDSSDAALFLEHCSECDDCRRTLALLSVPRHTYRMPPGMEARAVASLRRALDRGRDRMPRPLRRILPPRMEPMPVGFLIAGALLVGIVAVLVSSRKAPLKANEARELVHQEIPSGAPLAQVAPRSPLPKSPRLEPAPRPEATELARPPVPRTEEVRPEPPAPPIAQEGLKPVEPKGEEPARTASSTVVARVLSELQITDITGPLSIHRKGARSNEPLKGVARLAEGDVLTAEKPVSFHVEGRHPVVLAESTQISMAYVAQEQAPWLRLHSGEATVDSTGAARWVVTDGSVAVSIKPARAMFAAARSGPLLSLSSLSEPLYVQPDGGQVRGIHPGEELQVGTSSAEIRTLAPGVAARKSAAFDAARPKSRTIFYTSCDPVDAKREHFFVQEGTWYKNEALLSRDHTDRDRSAVAAIGFNPRIAWRNSLVLRFRVLSNCKSVETQLRVDERKYTLWKVTALDRKNRDQWAAVEIPLEVPPAPQPPHWQFRRDDGGNLLTITPEDKFDSIRFIVRQSEVFSELRPWVLIDDVQVIQKE